MTQSTPPPIDWQQIDTVLLDMDGTLLDLHFDNYFWSTHLPERYAQLKGESIDEVTERLHAEIRSREGTLEWYCLDFWADMLDVDIKALKEEIQDKIRVRPHVEQFLEQLREANKRVVIITNAHPIGLNMKMERTKLESLLDLVISSHEFQTPKEAQEFWQQLMAREPFDPARTLFVDDTTRILDSARAFGIEHVLAIHQPDSQIERTVEGYPAISHFDEVLPILPSQLR